MKDATPQVQLVNGQADIAYTRARQEQRPEPGAQRRCVVGRGAGRRHVRRGHDAAGGRQLHRSPAALLDCSLGTLGPGVERTIGVSARVTQTGTYVNCATATGDGEDTNAREQQGLRRDARHCAADPAGDAADGRSRRRSRSRRSRSRSRRRALPRAHDDTRAGQGERPERRCVLAKVTQVARPRCRASRCGSRALGVSQGLVDERQGRRSPRPHAEQGRDHPSQDHQREGVQHRSDRRCRRLPAAGHGLGESPGPALGRRPRAAPGSVDASGERSAGPQGRRPDGPRSPSLGSRDARQVGGGTPRPRH